MYNPKLLRKLQSIFKEFDPVEMGDKDLYAYLASLVYQVPYEDCCEFQLDNYTPNPVGKERRSAVKQMLTPIVQSCGGFIQYEPITGEDVELYCHKQQDCGHCLFRRWCGNIYDMKYIADQLNAVIERD